MTAPLVLPQACPECGVLLQRPTPAVAAEDGPGVASHFKWCHPGRPVPLVAS